MQNQVNFRLAVLPELVFNASQEVSDIDILFSDSMGWGDVYPYEMRKGTYQLVLQLAGTNCRPKTKKIEITVAEEEPHVGVRMLT